MATTNLGRVTFVPQGNWTAGTYKYLDVVRNGAATYYCKTPTTTQEPSLIASDWGLLAQDASGVDAQTLQTTGASVNVGSATPPTT